MSPESGRVVICGGSGFLGQSLAKAMRLQPGTGLGALVLSDGKSLLATRVETADETGLNMLLASRKRPAPALMLAISAKP